MLGADEYFKFIKVVLILKCVILKHIFNQWFIKTIFHLMHFSSGILNFNVAHINLYYITGYNKTPNVRHFLTLLHPSSQSNFMYLLAIKAP